MAAEMKTGSYVGTGAAINIQLGWVPDRVEIINITDGDAVWIWHTAMGAGKAQAMGTLATLASNGVTAYNPTDYSAKKGFTIGTSLSESGKTFAYTASRSGDY